MASAAGGLARSSGSGRAGRCAARVLAAGDVTAEREEGPDLSRDERGEESVRLERAGDREQRRPAGWSPEPHRAGVPGGRIGATSSRPTRISTRTTWYGCSPATTGRRKGRRSGRTAVSRVQPVDAASSSASRRVPVAVSWPISVTTIRTTRRSLPRSRTCSTRCRRTASSRRAFSRVVCRTPSRFSREARL